MPNFLGETREMGCREDQSRMSIGGGEKEIVSRVVGFYLRQKICFYPECFERLGLPRPPECAFGACRYGCARRTCRWRYRRGCSGVAALRRIRSLTGARAHIRRPRDFVISGEGGGVASSRRSHLGLVPSG